MLVGWHVMCYVVYSSDSATCSSDGVLGGHAEKILGYSSLKFTWHGQYLVVVHLLYTMQYL